MLHNFLNFRYVLLFMMGIYANMRALENSNVETVIVARACTPLIVSILEYQFLGRTAPSFKSTMALGTIVLGAWFYVANDGKFEEQGIYLSLWKITQKYHLLCFKVDFTKPQYCWKLFLYQISFRAVLKV